ncbi:hypothetical protein PG984_006998 [Apiospora sp. TS-2023a]
MASVARTNRSRTEEQRQQDLDKIQKYRDLDDQIQHHVRARKRMTAVASSFYHLQISVPPSPTCKDPRIPTNAFSFRSPKQVKQSNYGDPALFQLTTKLLRLNPEYYTIWNVRRRCLIFGLLSKRSAGLWHSKASPSTSRSVTTKSSCAASSPSPSAATLPAPATSPSPPKAGASGTTPEIKEKEGDNNAATNPADGARKEEGGDEKADVAADTAIVQSELAFTIPLLIEFPKCYWIWGYRSFLLSVCDAILPAGAARDFWVAELALDSKMLTKDRRNFHAWSYRRFIVSALESTAKTDVDASTTAKSMKSMTESEFAYTYSMIKVDLSNFSAWHNRSKLAPRLLEERGADDAARKKFLDQELELARDGLNVGPEDQSLWYYHQFLMDQIIVPGGVGAMGLIAPNLSLADRREFLDREVTEIKDLLVDYADVKLIYEALLEYAMANRAMGESAADTANQDEMMGWLAKLKELDPLRRGRWDDLEKSLKAR